MISDIVEIIMEQKEKHKIESFFRGIEYTRGYGLDSDIGEIADKAFHLWLNIEDKNDRIEGLKKGNKILYDSYKKKIKNMESEIEDLKCKLSACRNYINELALKIIHNSEKG